MQVQTNLAHAQGNSVWTLGKKPSDVTPVDECRKIAIEAFERLGKESLPSLIEVESTDLKLLDVQSTNGRILSVIVTALNKAGIPTKPTVGDVRGKLGLSEDEIDDLFCFCMNGSQITGRSAALRLVLHNNRA